MQLCQKPKNFSELFAAVSKSSLNFKRFEKKMALLHYLFLRLRAPKT